MAYNFPDNPVQDQEFTPPGGNQPTYIWQTPRWIIKGVPPANSGGIVDAPNDGQQYGRQSAGWTVVAPAPTWTTLAGKPATFPPTVPIAWTDVSGKPATFPPTVPIAWTDISGKPATFPPPIPSVTTLGGVFSYTAPANEYLIGISTSGQPVSAPIAGIPSASGAIPVMDGVGAAGVAVQWSRGDHVHPSDTNKGGLYVDNGWFGSQIISLNSAGKVHLNLYVPVGAVAGSIPLLDFQNDRTPAPNDTPAVIRFWARDSAGNLAGGSVGTPAPGPVAQLICIENPPTPGAVSVQFYISTMQAGVGANRLVLGAGVYTPGVTDKGMDTINALSLYENGVSLANKYHQIIPRYYSVVTSASPTPDVATTDLFGVLALNTAAAIGAPLNGGPAKEGQKLMLRIRDDGTARALTWNAIYRAGLDLPLPLTTVAGKLMYCAFMFNSVDTRWDYVAQVGNF